MRRGNASKIAALENDIARIDTLMPRIDPDCCSIKTVSGKASVQKAAKKQSLNDSKVMVAEAPEKKKQN